MERVKEELKNHRAQEWHAHIPSIDGTLPSIHRLCWQLGQTAESIRPLFDEEGALHYKAEERAELFADCLERQFQPNPSLNEDHTGEVEQHLERYFQQQPNEEEEKVFFSPGQVKKTLQRSNPMKAPGARYPEGPAGKEGDCSRSPLAHPHCLPTRGAEATAPGPRQDTHPEAGPHVALCLRKAAPAAETETTGAPIGAPNTPRPLIRGTSPKSAPDSIPSGPANPSRQT